MNDRNSPKPDIRQPQSERVNAIKTYNANRTAQCLDVIRWLLLKDETTKEEREDRYRIVALMASILGFSSMINTMNGMKSPLKDPYVLGMVMVLNRIDTIYTSHEYFFDHASYFIAAYRELVNRTFEANQQMRDNLTAIFDAYVDREKYEQRKADREKGNQAEETPKE